MRLGDGFHGVTGSDLVTALGQLQERLGIAELAVIRVSFDEAQFDWDSLGPPSCGIPGLPVGQDWDARYSTNGFGGLHAQGRNAHGVVEFHLDNPDPCRDAVGHLLNDTKVQRGAVIGLTVGAVVGALLEGRRGAVKWGVRGAGAGATLGALAPKRPRRIFPFENVFGGQLPALGRFAA
jgi:hypothetical protein